MARGFKDDDVVIEAQVKHTTPKAYLIEDGTGKEFWLPKSQVVYVGEPDVDGNREFTITAWIAKQNGIE